MVIERGHGFPDVSIEATGGQVAYEHTNAY